MYPKKMEEYPEEMEFLGRKPDRVTLIPVEMNHLDRMAELHSIPEYMRQLLCPIGTPYCDFDFVISSRIPMLPMFRVLSGRQTGFKKGSMRGIFGLEEMPILSFRDTVAWGNTMELQTITSYLLSDGIMMNNLWTEKLLNKVAAKYLSASSRRELNALVREVVPVRLTRLNLRKEGYTDGDDFNVGFTGRITATRSFDKVAELFRKQFAYPLGKNRGCMKFVVSTNSKDFGAHKEDDISFVDVQFNGREEFHESLKRMHVALNLSDVEDFSLSTYETILSGVPIIVYEKDWNSFLGEDYPFRVRNEVECYAMLKAFTENYRKMYAKFVAWEKTHWKALVEGPKNFTTSEALWERIQAFAADRHEYVFGRGLGGSYREIAEEIAHKEEVNFVTEMEARGKVMLKENAMLMRAPAPLMMKELLSGMGFSDTNAPGVMRKSV